MPIVRSLNLVLVGKHLLELNIKKAGKGFQTDLNYQIKYFWVFSSLNELEYTVIGVAISLHVLLLLE